jgi:hypothetical protein
MLACPQMACISDCYLLAAGSEAEERRNPETKWTAVIFVVHSSHVEIVARKGENCHRKLRYDQNLPQLLASWAVQDIACDTKLPSKVKVNSVRTTLAVNHCKKNMCSDQIRRSGRPPRGTRVREPGPLDDPGRTSTGSSLFFSIVN